MGSVASVLICQQSPKEEKGKWMWRHKSLGLLTGMIVAPRIGYRLMNAAKYKVGHPTGKSCDSNTSFELNLPYFIAFATHITNRSFNHLSSSS